MEEPRPQERQPDEVPPEDACETPPKDASGAPPEDGREAPEDPRETPDELAELRARAAEYLELSQRLKADFDNYRRRSERDLAESRRLGTAELMGKLLAVLDNLERAAGSPEDGPALRDGLLMTLKQMRTVFEREGVARIESLGRPFDPTLHEALLTVPAGEHPPGTVTQVFEEGYKMGDRLLRPARVAVAEEQAQEEAREDRAGEEGTDG